MVTTKPIASAKLDDITTILADLNGNHLAYIRAERSYESYARLMRVLVKQLADAVDGLSQ